MNKDNPFCAHPSFLFTHTLNLCSPFSRWIDPETVSPPIQVQVGFITVFPSISKLPSPE
jgi:hypothetical protein